MFNKVKIESFLISRRKCCCNHVKVEYHELDLSLQHKGYNKKEKYCMMILFLILYISLALISGWAYVWNTSYTESLSVTIKITQDTVTEVFHFPFKAYNTSSFLLDSAQNIVLQTRNSSDSFPSLLNSIDNISLDLNNTVDIVRKFLLKLAWNYCHSIRIHSSKFK